MCCFALVIVLVPRPHLPGLYVALLNMYSVITQRVDSALMIAVSEGRTEVVSLHTGTSSNSTLNWYLRTRTSSSADFFTERTQICQRCARTPSDRFFVVTCRYSRWWSSSRVTLNDTICCELSSEGHFRAYPCMRSVVWPRAQR